MAKLHFSLVAPERELYSGEVDQVIAPGVDGQFGVLAGHAPFMTTLQEGEVTVLDGAARRSFAIRGGFADVTASGLTILAEHATEA
ncbi:MAG: ATP synthase F1 subunit epsilon [Pseudomonadota bacterium]|nr:ATP synthase F1 subunit epsilon [Pseudomonadota bacterium]